MATLVWEELNANGYYTYRAKVPGGWLVVIDSGHGSGLTFYPDPQHEWNGASLR